MKLLKLVITCLIVCLTLSTVTCLASKSKAKYYYDKAEAYAVEGKWDLAADNFELAAKEYSNFNNVQERLEDARLQACRMLIQIGDDAKLKEKYEEAVIYYQKALHYKPNSTEAKSKIDNLGQEIVVANYNRGRNYEAQNRLNEAYKEYEKAYNINPDFKDLRERYQSLKAKIQSNIPTCAILFFINHTDKLGIENSFFQAFNSELALACKDKLFVMDYRKVQAVLKEQANALGDNLSINVAIDIGRILGADQIIIGDISSSDKKRRIEITAKLYKVSQIENLKEEKVSVKYDSMDELQNKILTASKKIARKIVD